MPLLVCADTPAMSTPVQQAGSSSTAAGGQLYPPLYVADPQGVAAAPPGHCQGSTPSISALSNQQQPQPVPLPLPQVVVPQPLPQQAYPQPPPWSAFVPNPQPQPLQPWGSGVQQPSPLQVAPQPWVAGQPQVPAPLPVAQTAHLLSACSLNDTSPWPHPSGAVWYPAPWATQPPLVS